FDVAWHFKTALENMPVITQYELQKKYINLESQITKIMSWFDGDGILLFSSLMKRLIHKVEIIVSFLAVLELIQQGIIQVLQNEIFGEIEFHYLGNKA
ncbi:MAG: segregation/condensation protein A, partial [Candidatus Marinimicrobia bacterium]|nr:segregation/condensation protein A [Candidatus Neomarinimicrobiota bacterium]